jgi:DNA invertase Pin-like site-specific DNA recombinase
MTDRHAAAYIRRSSVSGDSPGDASREAQLEATRRLAQAFAPESDLSVYSDWGISGRRDDRPEYVNLKAEIKAGRVCCVFSYSLSRLGRTARELNELFDLCESQDVQVITQADGTLTATSATGKFLRRILAELAELESELAKERSAAARAAKRERGDVFGQPPYGFAFGRDDNRRVILVPNPDEQIAPLLDAYRDAGSVLGACRLLEERGIPAPKGGKRWATSALTRIIERQAPELLPQRSPVGRRTPSSAMLAQLLRCPFCDKLLTPNIHRGQYYCSNGPRDRAAHPRYAVREADILPFLQAEAARYRAPLDAVETEGTEAREAAIAERMDRAHELYMAGDIDRERFEAEKARAARDRADLARRPSLARLHPEVDWDVSPDVINAALRAIWREVRLDENLRPVEVDWTFPELRG